MRKATSILCAGAALLLASACTERQPARDVTAAKAPAQPPARVTLTPVTEPKTVQVTPVGHDGKPVGPPQTVQLTPEANPAEVGLTPVPAGSQ
jgi:hypothetical protein